MDLEELLCSLALSQLERAASKVLRAPEEVTQTLVLDFRRLKPNRFYDLGKRGLSQVDFLNGVRDALSAKDVEHLVLGVANGEPQDIRIRGFSICRGEQHEVRLEHDAQSLIELARSMDCDLIYVVHNHVGLSVARDALNAVLDLFVSMPSTQDRLTTRNLKKGLEDAGVKVVSYVIAPNGDAKRIFFPTDTGQKVGEALRSIVSGRTDVGARIEDLGRDILHRVIDEFQITITRRTSDKDPSPP